MCIAPGGGRFAHLTKYVGVLAGGGGKFHTLAAPAGLGVWAEPRTACGVMKKEQGQGEGRVPPWTLRPNPPSTFAGRRGDE